MKLKLLDLIQAAPALSHLANEKCSGRLAYNISRNIRVIQPELAEYEKARVSLIENKYGEKGEDESYSVSPVKVKEFLSDLEEIQKEELDLDIRTIVLPDDMQIAPVDLYLLDWMITIAEA